MASPVDLAHEVIDISRVGLIWIRFGAQAIERVINILNGLVLAVGLRGQVIELVVKWRASRLSPHYLSRIIRSPDLRETYRHMVLLPYQSLKRQLVRR